MTLKSRIVWGTLAISLLVFAGFMTHQSAMVETGNMPLSTWYAGVGFIAAVFGILFSVITIVAVLGLASETPKKVFDRLYLDDDIPSDEYNALMFQIKSRIMAKLTQRERGFLTSGKYNRFREMRIQ
jgi:hypothetical protein